MSGLLSRGEPPGPAFGWPDDRLRESPGSITTLLAGSRAGAPSCRPRGHGSRARLRRLGKTSLIVLLFTVLAFAATCVSPAFAVEPGEMLKDPALEARARTISAELRCLVCQNESIDESHADLARDIRVIVRQRLEAGDSNAQVRDYLVARYGQFILLKPPFEWQTALLWSTPLIALALGATGVFLALRRRPTAHGDANPLSAEEQRRLDTILADGPSDPRVG